MAAYSEKAAQNNIKEGKDLVGSTIFIHGVNNNVPSNLHCALLVGFLKSGGQWYKSFIQVSSLTRKKLCLIALIFGELQAGRERDVAQIFFLI